VDADGVATAEFWDIRTLLRGSQRIKFVSQFGDSLLNVTNEGYWSGALATKHPG
jgi:hypothetical protein